MGDERKETFQVKRKISVGEFLRRGEPEYPQFKVKILLNCGAVTVSNKGQPVEVLQSASVELAPPAIVRIKESKCGDALTRIRAERFVDYAFVPRKQGDNYLDWMRGMLAARPQTRIPERSTPGGLVDLHWGDLDEPIRDLIFVSHGHAQGELELPIEVDAPRVLDYETILKLAEGNSLRVDKLSMAQPRPPKHDPRGESSPDSGSPLTVRFRGCQIGAIPPYLEVRNKAKPEPPPQLVHLKKAFGVERLVAPKYIHSVMKITNEPKGWLEFLRYGFEAKLADHEKSLAPLITHAFKGQGGTLHDGKTPVSEEQWKQWLKPADPRKTGPLEEPGYVNSPLKVALKRVVAKIPGTGIKLELGAELLMIKQRLFDAWNSVAAAQEPPDVAKKKLLVRDQLARFPGYEESHPFPKWGRLGYVSLDDMMQRMHWDFVWDEGNLAYDAWHFRYILSVPMLDDGSLIGNFYPDNGKPTIRLTEDDPRFFTTV